MHRITRFCLLYITTNWQGPLQRSASFILTRTEWLIYEWTTENTIRWKSLSPIQAVLFQSLPFSKADRRVSRPRVPRLNLHLLLRISVRENTFNIFHIHSRLRRQEQWCNNPVNYYDRVVWRAMLAVRPSARLTWLTTVRRDVSQPSNPEAEPVIPDLAFPPVLPPGGDNVKLKL